VRLLQGGETVGAQELPGSSVVWEIGGIGYKRIFNFSSL
jgi:hypothetical protein